MKQRIQGIIIGLLAAFLISSVTVWAAMYSQYIEVTYRDIKLHIDGVLITPRDVSGNIVEPFIYNGTTYLPVRAVGEAFGKRVEWEGNSNTVYVGERLNKPAKEIFLYSKPYLEIGDSKGFEVLGNHIYVYSKSYDIVGNVYVFKNYVVYPLNMAAIKFTATLHPPLKNNSWTGASDLIYRIYGDDELIYTSPTLTHSDKAISIDLGVSKYILLKIEVEHRNKDSYGYQNLSIPDYKGIENAIIVTTDY